MGRETHTPRCNCYCSFRLTKHNFAGAKNFHETFCGMTKTLGQRPSNTFPFMVRRSTGTWAHKEHSVFLRGVQVWQRNWAVASLVAADPLCETNKNALEIDKGEQFTDRFSRRINIYTVDRTHHTFLPITPPPSMRLRRKYDERLLVLQDTQASERSEFLPVGFTTTPRLYLRSPSHALGHQLDGFEAVDLA